MKRALLVGINYKGTENELNGCQNDANNMHLFLTTEKGFNPRNVVVLTDNTSDVQKLPTKDNILRQLTVGIGQMKAGDTFVFHYSGHGSQIKDLNRDEKDSLDETLVPVDFVKNGQISDDTLKSIIANVPEGSKFVAIIDACHSETSFDLKYIYDPVTQREAKKKGKQYLRRGGIKIKANSLLTKIDKNLETKGQVICMSGCKDSQTSMDAHIKGQSQGALTASLLEIFKSGDCKLTYLPVRSRDFIINNKLGTQIPRLSFGRSDFILDKTELF